MRIWLAIVTGVFLVTGASSAIASPWTLPKDTLSMTLSYELQQATEEYQSDGNRREFPLDGRFNANAVNLGLRYGLTDRLEFEFDAQFKSIAYKADAAVLRLPAGVDSVDLQGARDAVYDFSASEMGVGDIYAVARYNLLRKPMGAISSETRAKLPTGYRAPGQTFADPTNPNPTGLEDDAVLGDGQTDIEQSILLGAYIPMTRTFARAGVGARLRFGAPGHQVIGDLKIGQFIGSSFVLFGGARAALTVLEGDTIGTTFVTNRNNVTAQNITDADIERKPLSLDKDFVQTEAGFLMVLTSDAELQAVYSYIPVGKNISAVHSVLIGMTIKIGSLTGP